MDPPGHQLEQAGFARPVGPDDSDFLIGREFKVEIPEKASPAKRKGNVLQGQNLVTQTRRIRKSQVGNDKDALAMQLKAATMRRELMSLTAEDNTDNEESTLNFFFTALTREEMEQLKEVEVNHGTGDDSALMAMGGEDAEEDVAAKAKKRNEKNAQLTGSSPDYAAAIEDMTPEQREELLMALVAKEGK